jgi:hypothetical protein
MTKNKNKKNKRRQQHRIFVVRKIEWDIALYELSIAMAGDDYVFNRVVR